MMDRGNPVAGENEVTTGSGGKNTYEHRKRKSFKSRKRYDKQK